jgi:O-antigen/teichoic acid export membrane protein
MQATPGWPCPVRNEARSICRVGTSTPVSNPSERSGGLPIRIAATLATYRFLPRGQLIRDICLLSGATFAGQVITVAAMPIIARCYTPEEFGLFGVYTSIVAILAVVATLRYDIAVPLPRRDREAGHLLVVSLAATGAMTLAVAVVIGMMHANLVPTPTVIRTLGSSAWLLPVGMAATAGAQAISSWAVRERDFPLLAGTKFRQGATGIALQIALGAARTGAAGLVLGHLAGQAAGLRRLIGKAHGSGVFRHVTPRRAIRACHAYRAFPLYAWPAAMCSAASLALPALFLESLYGPEASGHFCWTQRVLAVPAMLVGNAVCQVYFGHVARCMREEPEALVPLFHATVRRLTMAAIPFLLVAPFFPDLFSLVFGGRWHEAGLYARMLAISSAAGFIVTPASMLTTLGYSGLQLVWDAGRCMTIAVVFVTCLWLRMPADEAVLAYGIAMTCWYVILWAMNRAVVHQPLSATPSHRKAG